MIPSEFYSKIADKYELYFNKNKFIKEDNKLFDIIKKFIKGKVLDIGCGSGEVLENIEITKDNYIGIDPALGMINLCQKRFPKHVFHLSQFEFYQTDKKFDTILALYGTFSYIENHYSYQKVLDILNPNGIYFLMFYKPNYYPVTYKKFKMKPEYELPDMNKIKKVFGELFDFDNYIIVTNYASYTKKYKLL